MQNDKELDSLTRKLVKSMGEAEPSSDFTDEVMKSVLTVSVPIPQQESRSSARYWLLLLIPVFLFGGFYLYAFPEVLNSGLHFFKPFLNYITSITSVFTGFIQNLLSIRLSPFVLIGSLAIFLLLIADILATGRKYRINGR